MLTQWDGVHKILGIAPDLTNAEAQFLWAAFVYSTWSGGMTVEQGQGFAAFGMVYHGAMAMFGGVFRGWGVRVRSRVRNTPRIATQRPPRPGSLNNAQARQWYLDQLSGIRGRIDTTRSLEQQARQAHGMRNQIRTQTRNAMSDRGLAEALNRTDPHSTWGEIVNRYAGKGYSGDALWRAIIDSSARSRPSVNQSLGLP